MPSACETDIAGVVGMYAMALASGKPSALVDWNNNYGNDPDKCVIFHCSNLPKDVFSTNPIKPDETCPSWTTRRSSPARWAKRTPTARSSAASRPSPSPICRVSTDDVNGVIAAYLGEGELTNDPLTTFGGFGVVHIPNLQELLRYICENGFEHHTAINLSRCAGAVNEALQQVHGLGRLLPQGMSRHHSVRVTTRDAATPGT